MKRALLEQARRAGLQLGTLRRRHAALTAAIRALEEDRELAMLQLQRLEGTGSANSDAGIRGNSGHGCRNCRYRREGGNLLTMVATT